MSDMRILKVGQEGTVRFSIHDQINPICSGMAALVQTTLLHLLTSPGSDALNPGRGGGLGSLCRQYRTYDGDLRDAIIERVRSTEFFIKDEQKYVPLSADEKLSELFVIDIREGDDPTEVLIEIGIRSESGSAVRVAL